MINLLLGNIAKNGNELPANLIFIGDSLTSYSNYPLYVWQKCKEGTLYLNNGLGGDDLGGAISTYSYYVQDELLEGYNNVIVLLIGIHDYKHSTFSADLQEYNHKVYYDLVRADNAKLLLVGYPDNQGTIYSRPNNNEMRNRFVNHWWDYANAFADIYNNNVELQDSGDSDYFAADLVHVLNSGQILMANTVYDTLKKII